MFDTANCVVTVALPVTCNLYVGDVVPIPTLPELNIVIFV